MSPKSNLSQRLAFLRRRIASLFTLDGFAVAPVWAQQSLVLLFCIVTILIFWPLVGSLRLSARLFMQTTGVEELNGGWHQIVLGLAVFIVGVITMSFIVGILTTALYQLLERIKSGTLPYKRSNHWVVINTNEMLVDILSEINDLGIDSNRVMDVVVLVDNLQGVHTVREQLFGRTFVSLDVFVRHGSLHNRETFERINLCAASGVMILQDDQQTDDFARDNHTLKTLLILSGWPHFVQTLRQRHLAIKPFKFITQISGSFGADKIISSLAAIDGAPLLLAVDPHTVADHLLGRAIVDVTYYRIFNELFSFSGHEIYFIDPARFGCRVEGRRFREIAYGFTRGVVMGRSRFRDNDFQTEIGPMEEILQPGDWLIVLAENAQALTFDPARKFTPPSVPIPQPNEIVHRRICVVGDEHDFPSLLAFLDEESRTVYQENRVVLDEPRKYLEYDLIDRLKNGPFDRIVLNLPDELAFRMSALIHSLYRPDDPFLDRIITVIENPVTDEILNAGSKSRNTVLSRRLCAKYLTQVLFQKTLSRVIQDLCNPSGYEINLMEVGVDIPRESLAEKDQVRQLLLGSGIIYAGIIDQDDNLIFDTGDFTHAKKLIVFSQGSM